MLVEVMGFVIKERPMRALSKILLSACTVCALGHVHGARAGNPVPGPGQSPAPQPLPPDQVPPPPVPTDVPGQPPNPNIPGPSAPNPTPTGEPADPTAPAAGVPITPVPTATPDTPPVANPPSTPTAVIAPTADDDDDYNVYSYAWYEPRLSSGIGVSTILGGGVTGFTDRAMRTTTSDVGGLWDLRVTIGSHLPIALVASYVGTATNINGLPNGNRGTLIGTTAEGAVQFNLLPHLAFTPYIFGGAGWQRYDVTQTHVSLSDSGMNSSDNLLEFPMGGGFAYRSNGFVVDLRGTFRYTTDQNLVLSNPTLFSPTVPTSNDFVPMHTWEASAALGYEF